MRHFEALEIAWIKTVPNGNHNADNLRFGFNSSVMEP